MRKTNEWSDSIGDAVKGAQRNLTRGHGRLNEDRTHTGMHITSKGNVVCYDVTCPICDKDATKVTTTTVYHKPNTHDDKVKDIERQKLMEDFKYNVAKNCTAIEKKVNKALDLNNDEIIRVNQRIDLLTNKVKQTPSTDLESFKNHFEKRLLEMDQRHHNAFDELEEENSKLQGQIDGLK